MIPSLEVILSCWIVQNSNIYFYVYRISAAQIVIIPVKMEKSKLLHERFVCQKLGRETLAKWTTMERAGWEWVGWGGKKHPYLPRQKQYLKRYYCLEGSSNSFMGGGTREQWIFYISFLFVCLLCQLQVLGLKYLHCSLHAIIPKSVYRLLIILLIRFTVSNLYQWAFLDLYLRNPWGTQRWQVCPTPKVRAFSKCKDHPWHKACPLSYL